MNLGNDCEEAQPVFHQVSKLFNRIKGDAELLGEESERNLTPPTDEPIPSEDGEATKALPARLEFRSKHHLTAPPLCGSIDAHLSAT
jgi:hypothetical protein